MTEVSRTQNKEPHFINNDCTINEEWINWFIEEYKDITPLSVDGVLLSKLITFQLRLTVIIKECWKDSQEEAMEVFRNDPAIYSLLMRVVPPKPTLFQRFIGWIKGK